MVHFHSAFEVMNWLVWKATGEYWFLIPLGLLSPFMVLAARRNAGVYLLLILPILWLIPLAVATAAWDWSYPGDKTAAWVGGFPVLAALAAQVLASIYLIVTLKGARILAGLTAVFNAVPALCGGLIVSLASTGNWGV